MTKVKNEKWSDGVDYNVDVVTVDHLQNIPPKSHARSTALGQGLKCETYHQKIALWLHSTHATYIRLSEQSIKC